MNIASAGTQQRCTHATRSRRPAHAKDPLNTAVAAHAAWEPRTAAGSCTSACPSHEMSKRKLERDRRHVACVSPNKTYVERKQDQERTQIAPFEFRHLRQPEAGCSGCCHPDAVSQLPENDVQSAKPCCRGFCARRRTQDRKPCSVFQLCKHIHVHFAVADMAAAVAEADALIAKGVCPVKASFLRPLREKQGDAASSEAPEERQAPSEQVSAQRKSRKRDRKVCCFVCLHSRLHCSCCRS